MIPKHAAGSTRSNQRAARVSKARRRRRRLSDPHWLLIGALVFGLEIVLAVGVLQLVV